MAESCVLCYITDRKAFPGDECARRRRLLEKIAEAARAGVDYIQLREKDLPTRQLESLARETVSAIRGNAHLRTGNRGLRTFLLINSRTDVALAVGADGVHLPADDISPAEVQSVWKWGAGARSTGSSPAATGEKALTPIIGVSCHSAGEVAQAAAHGADFALFAPVFEKKDAPGARPAGLAAVREACRARISVLALGGVTLENAAACLEAGAAGVAAIRLFQGNDIAEVVRRLRR